MNVVPAEKLDRAEARVSELAEALAPFTHPDLSKRFSSNSGGDEAPVYGRDGALLKLGDFRRAARVLGRYPETDVAEDLRLFSRGATTIAKHEARTTSNLRATIERLDSRNDARAADTVAWLVWHLERTERALAEALAALAEDR